MEKNYIRLKGSIQDDQFLERLSRNPEILELHLLEQDIYNLDNVYNAIKKAQYQGVKVYLHHPMSVNKKPLNILSDDPEVKDFYYLSTVELAKLAMITDTKLVIHAHYGNDPYIINLPITGEVTDIMRDRINEFQDICGESLLWEDSVAGPFSAKNIMLLDRVVKPLNLNLTLDISHSFIALKGNNDLLLEQVKAMKPYTKYYHVVDSLGIKHDALTLGTGLINWNNIVPIVGDMDSIFEIDLGAPFDNSQLMVDSGIYWKTIQRLLK